LIIHIEIYNSVEICFASSAELSQTLDRIGLNCKIV